MENEETTVEAVTTQPVAPQDKPNETVETTPVVEQPHAPEVDYVAEYEKERERREKAEFALYKKKKAERAAKQIQEQDSETGVVDAESIRKQVEETFYAAYEAKREQEASDLIEEELMRISNNADERKLIRFKYDNAINKTGFSRSAIRQDLEDAQFLANKPKYLKEKTELAQAAISKQTITNSGGGTNLDKPQHNEDLSKLFTKQDWEFMQKRKWTTEQIKSAAQQLRLK